MIEAIFKGATRPPMKFGVPLIPLMVLAFPGFIVGMWLGTIVDWRLAFAIFSIVIFAYGWMRVVTKHDDQRLNQMLVNLKLSAGNPNRIIRQRSRSYAATNLRGGSHAWRR